MTTYTKMNHTIPEEARLNLYARLSTLTPREARDLRGAYAAVLRSKGWTLQSIADIMGISRERVRQLARLPLALAEEAVAGYNLQVPEVPLREVVKRSPRVFIEPSPETLSRLLELQPLAQKVRGHGKTNRAEGEEYTRLLDYAHRVEGVTLYRLAKRLGVTHGALRFRLARYGYKAPINGTSRVYNLVLDKNRVVN